MVDMSKDRPLGMIRKRIDPSGDGPEDGVAIAKAGFLRALGILFSSRVVSAVSLLAIGIITARLLGPEGRGHYALFFTIVGIGANLGGFGLTQSNTYFLNREQVSMAVLFGNTIFATGVVGLLAAVGIEIVDSYPGVAGMSDSWVFPSRLLWLAIVAAVLESHLGGLAYGSHLYAFQARSLVLQAALLITATLALYPAGASLTSAIEFRVAAAVLFVGWYVQRFLTHVSLREIAIRPDTLKKQLRFGIKNWLQNLVGLLNYRGCLLVLAAFGGSESIGYFSIALLFAEAVRFIPETVGTLLLPKLVRLRPGEGPAQLAAKACRMNVLCAALLGSGLAVSVGWLIPIVFGELYAGSVAATILLLPGAVLGVVYQVLTRYFTSEHAQRYSIAGGVLGLIVAFSASVALVPVYQAAGASAAYSLSALTTCLVVLWGFGRQSKLPPSSAIIPSRDDWVIVGRFAVERVMRAKTRNKERKR
jgi:antigen flippase